MSRPCLIHAWVPDSPLQYATHRKNVEARRNFLERKKTKKKKASPKLNSGVVNLKKQKPGVAGSAEAPEG